MHRWPIAVATAAPLLVFTLVMWLLFEVDLSKTAKTVLLVSALVVCIGTMWVLGRWAERRWG